MDDGCAAVFLVGWHARANGAGVLAHTINGFAFARVLVNGADIGEAGLYGAVAAEFGVPVALCTGDDRFAAEAAAHFPQAVVVPVKTAQGQRAAEQPVAVGGLRGDRGRRDAKPPRACRR